MGFLNQILKLLGIEKKEENTAVKKAVENIYDAKSITIFLNWAKNKKMPEKEDDYPQFLNFDAGIKNPVWFHKNMISQGYMCPADMIVSLNSLNTVTLKQFLSSKKKDTMGARAKLVQRILDEIPEQEIKEFLGKDSSSIIYTLTEAGEKFLKENYFYIELRNHEHLGISEAEYKEAKESFNYHADFYEVAWKILNQKNLQQALSGNWKYVRDIILNMAEILKEQPEKEENALKMYITVLYYDLSGWRNGNKRDSYEKLTLNPALLKAILGLKKYYKDNMLSQLDLIDQLPSSYFSKSMFYDILNDLFAERRIVLENYKYYIKEKEFGLKVKKKDNKEEKAE